VSGDRITLEVAERGPSQLGSPNVRRLRKQGLVPGVLYGKVNKPIVVAERDLRTALTGPSGLNAIVDVVIAGQTTPHHAILKDFQQHPIKGTIVHVDFHEVRLDQPIQTTVPVHLVGESVGVGVGGVLTQVARELHVSALPAEVPEHIDVDVSALEIGDTLRLAEIPPRAGLTFLDDPEETVIANVAAPRSEEELEALETPAEEELAEGEEPVAEGEEGEGEESDEAAESTEPPADAAE
jgi:large subunit ribosomal protein L25